MTKNITKLGIILQGTVSNCTHDIIKEHQKNFSGAEIILSTWENEKTDGINCKIIQSKPPKMPSPIPMTVNHQKIGALAGLQNTSAKIIMKCRTDQFIYNPKIFEIFEKNCPKHKIMIPNYTTVDSVDYFASDFCQIATKEVLLDYWESMPIFDGLTPYSHPEIYLTSKYILRNKKDTRSWPICRKEYYYVKDYHKDFQIKWEKLETQPEPYQRWYDEWYSKCVKPD
jgi:hypothetical protein